MAGGAIGDPADLGRGDLPERLLDEGVVHAREHQLLPDEDPELVAELVERVLLVGPEPGQPDHVHAGCPDRLQGGPELRMGRDEVDAVERRPERPAGKDGDAVDVDEQPVALDVVIRPRSGRDRPEADPSEVDRCGFARAIAGTNGSSRT